jgi:hypothetical protein
VAAPRPHGLVEAPSGLERRAPAAGGIGASRERPHDGARPVHQHRPQRDRAAFRDPPPAPSAPLECCRGPSPSHAAHWRPFLTAWALPTVATRAVAGTGPMPGAGRSPWGRVHLPRHRLAPPVVDRDPFLHRPQAVGPIGEHLAGPPRPIGRLQEPGPGAAQRPHAPWHDQPLFGQQPARLVDPRGALRDQELAGLLPGPPRLLRERLDRHKAHGGRPTASPIASASLPSFWSFCCYGATHCGAISRTAWPRVGNSRAQ